MNKIGPIITKPGRTELSIQGLTTLDEIYQLFVKAVQPVSKIVSPPVQYRIPVGPEELQKAEIQDGKWLVPAKLFNRQLLTMETKDFKLNSASNKFEFMPEMYAAAGLGSTNYASVSIDIGGVWHTLIGGQARPTCSYGIEIDPTTEVDATVVFDVIGGFNKGTPEESVKDGLRELNEEGLITEEDIQILAVDGISPETRLLDGVYWRRPDPANTIIYAILKAKADLNLRLGGNFAKGERIASGFIPLHLLSQACKHGKMSYFGSGGTTSQIITRTKFLLNNL